jgi:hypothetical protein
MSMVRRRLAPRIGGASTIARICGPGSRQAPSRPSFLRFAPAVSARQIRSKAGKSAGSSLMLGACL